MRALDADDQCDEIEQRLQLFAAPAAKQLAHVEASSEDLNEVHDSLVAAVRTFGPKLKARGYIDEVAESAVLDFLGFLQESVPAEQWDGAGLQSAGWASARERAAFALVSFRTRRARLSLGRAGA